jgi:Skp family chaperone for outer membrane proteins
MFTNGQLPLLIFVSLLLAGCGQTAADNASPSTSGEASATSNNGMHIVHIKSDSLQTGYTALAVELARLEENINKAQENLAKEGNALQREVQTLQNKAQQGLLSPNQIQSEQQRIARKEQDILQRREVAMGSIQQEQMELQNRFAEKVREILTKLKEEKGYDYILNQGPGTAVLVADDAHDITSLVLERLNAAEAVLQEKATSENPETEE